MLLLLLLSLRYPAATQCFQEQGDIFLHSIPLHLNPQKEGKDRQHSLAEEARRLAQTSKRASCELQQQEGWAAGLKEKHPNQELCKTFPAGEMRNGIARGDRRENCLEGHTWQSYLGGEGRALTLKAWFVPKTQLQQPTGSDTTFPEALLLILDSRSYLNAS